MQIHVQHHHVSRRRVAPDDDLRSGRPRPRDQEGVPPRPGRLLHLSFHTYFVGDESWSFSIWAHNACTIEQARAAVARHGGVEIGEGRFLFSTRRAARQAASEIAGDLGPGARPIRLSEFEGGPWWTRNSNRVIGRQSADGMVGWRDDFLGHPRFGAGPHVNVWGQAKSSFICSTKSSTVGTPLAQEDDRCSLH